MDFTHPDHPGKRVRLAYCTNLRPADDLDALLRTLEELCLPLRERLARRGAPFGVGLS